MNATKSNPAASGTVVTCDPLPETRKAWSTPLVITSDAREAQTNNLRGTDGSTPLYGPYGS